MYPQSAYTVHITNVKRFLNIFRISRFQITRSELAYFVLVDPQLFDRKIEQTGAEAGVSFQLVSSLDPNVRLEIKLKLKHATQTGKQELLPMEN